MSAKEFFRRKRKLTIIFGKPMNVTSLDGSPIPINEFKERANHIMNIVKDMV
jgi:hypothetical protein